MVARGAVASPPPVPRVETEAAGRAEESVLWDVVRRVYDIQADDRRFRESCAAGGELRARAFDRLRADYPIRREFRFTEVLARNASKSLTGGLTGLGFCVGVCSPARQ
ncbi:DUF3410 domain-containing protein [Verrucomicrobiota bacterium]